LAVPPDIVFASIDFDQETLPDKLTEAGFAAGRRSFFLLEGLLMYLQPESVDSTFRVIEAFGGPGSLVVFDYVCAPVLQGERDYYGAVEIRHTVGRAGERWVFGLEDAEIPEFLAKYGMMLVEQMDPQDLEERYFATADGQPIARVNGTHRIVKAARTSP
jgi:methyltransferase (TIGR00027 family)